MRIGVLHRDDERRVALTPDVVTRLIEAGHHLIVSKDAGLGAGHDDESYRNAGADIRPDTEVWDTDLVVCVRRPGRLETDQVTILGLLEPFDDPAEARRQLVVGSVTAFAFEAVPRVTRAQPVDALTSQATVAGYQAVIEGAVRSDRFFPMLTTAAGTIPPARVLVLGAGVAGLQAIATAKRLGARVAAFDVRSAAAEQVRSLGAEFIEILDHPQDQTTSGGYAREVTTDQETAILDGLAHHVSTADVVVTTAAIPGRPAPRLVSKAMVEDMRRGSVIVDIAAATGGNCELTQPDDTVEHFGVTIIGATDLASAVPRDASRMYARNVAAFVEMITGENGSISPDWDDEVVAGTAVVRSGRAVHQGLMEES